MRVIYHQNMFEKVCDAYHVALKLGRHISRVILTTEEYDEFLTHGMNSQWDCHIQVLATEQDQPRKLRFDYFIVEEEQ